MGHTTGPIFSRGEEIVCAAQGAAIIVTTAAVSIYKEDHLAGMAKGTAFASAVAATIAFCQIGVQKLADRAGFRHAHDKSRLITTDWRGGPGFVAWLKSKRL